MFRRIVPFAIAVLVSTGALAAGTTSAGRPGSAVTCPPIDAADLASDSIPLDAPPESLADSDELESRCDIDPLAYYLSYRSPAYDEDSATGMPNAVPVIPTSG